MSRIDQLTRRLRRRIHGKWYGQFASFVRGQGWEHEDARPYVLGDQPRHINWKLSAKRQTPFVNVYQQEQELQLDVLCDINYNRGGGEKEPYLMVVSDMLTDLSLATQSAGVSVTMYRGQDGVMQSQSLGKDVARLRQWIAQLSARVVACPAVYGSVLPEFVSAMHRNRRRRAILIISDGLVDGSDRLVDGLREYHEVWYERLRVWVEETRDTIGW